MKRRLKAKLNVQWEPETAFAMPMHRRVATARRAPEFVVEMFYRLEEEARRIAALVQ